MEIGLSVVVAYLGGPTTTNHEDLVMIVTCNTKIGQQENWSGLSSSGTAPPRKK